MGWLDKRREKLIGSWDVSCRVTGGKVSLVVARTVRSTPEAIEVRVRPLIHNTAVDLGLTTHGGTIVPDCSMATVTRSPDAQLSGRARDWPAVPLSTRVQITNDALDVQIRQANVKSFEVKLSHFVFDTPKREPVSRATLPREQQARGMKLDVIKNPERPKPESKADLRTQLLMLLAPPVNALLSDPQLTLPERPFRFQLEGIQWLMDRDCALLADEMGLGKTMQAILAARLLWKSGAIKNVLVICPKFLMANWEREIRYWWPQASDHIWRVDGSTFHSMIGSTGGNYIFKLLNYELLARQVDWVKERAAKHDLVIIDEAQTIKNSSAATSRAVKSLRSTRNWALTGTPVENHKRDFVSIFEFVRPVTVSDVMSEAVMKSAARPYMLRRRADDPDVGIQLPEIIDEDVPVDLGSSQREAYDRMERDGVMELNNKGDEVSVTHIFALIQKLQQLCNFEPSGGESAKLEFLKKDLEEVKDSERKALVFSQYVDERFGLKRLAGLLKSSYGLLECHGEIPPEVRQASVARFNSDPAIMLFLLNYRTGGAGLNLQAANYVYLFNRWWNPAVEQQALKRAHRIGQKNKVIVRRFVCRGTIEERIVLKLAEKRRLFSSIVDDAQAERDPRASTGLTEEELFSLFNLKVKPKSKSPEEPVRLVFENLTPQQFEALVAQVFERQGYDVKLIGGSGDGGIDVIAKKASSGGGEVLAIQCKHYSGTVGVSVARDLFGALNHDQSITRGVIAASSSFSADMKAFVAGKRISLMEGTQIRELAIMLHIASFS